MPRRTAQTPAPATTAPPAPKDTKKRPTARKRAQKTPKQKGSTTAVIKSAQPHGGALNVGGVPGNRGNPHPLGPPTALIRGELRGTYAERKVLLDEIVRGDLLTQTSVPLAEVMRHVLCGSCGSPVITKDADANVYEIIIPGKTTASVRDRLAALDQMAKYGVGTLKEVSVDNVRERVAQTLAAIRVHCTPEQAEVLYRALEPIWR